MTESRTVSPTSPAPAIASRKTVKNVALVGAGYALRLMAGMAVTVLIARTFGREEFGRFALWMSVSTLLTVAAGFGFPTMILRAFGAERGQASQIMQEVLTSKVVLSGLVLIAALIGALWMKPTDRELLLLLLGAQLADSFAEFYNLGFRFDGHFNAEARTAALVSVLHIVLMLAAIFLVHDIVAVAAAFFLSRLLAMLIVRGRAQACFGKIILGPLAQALKRARATWAYALELLLYTGYGQADSLVINLFLGHGGVGLYQAGKKLVDGACQLAPVIAQVVLPGLASAAVDTRAFKASAIRTLAIFGVLGLAGALVLCLGAGWISHGLYGDQFSELQGLMPMFGLLLLFRYLETGAGLLLVAFGLQHRKVWLVAVQLIVVLGAGVYVLGHYGLPGWQWVTILSLAGVAAAYLMQLFAHRNRRDAAPGGVVK